MIIADTSVWVDHLKKGDARLAARLEEGRILMHAWIIGELSLGALKRRDSLLQSLHELPQAPVCAPDEVLHFIQASALSGRGVGLVDAHMLASAKLIGATLWTRDRRLAEEAGRLGLEFVD